jgi:hypothetical protein
MKPECTRCRERLSEYLDGLLAAPERGEVDAHLAGCAECRRELDLWRATVQAMAELPRSGAPQGFGARVMARLGAGAEAAPERPRILSLWVRALPVAALVLVVLGVALMVEHRSAPAPSGGPVRLAQNVAPAAAASAPVSPAAGPEMAAPAATAAPSAAVVAYGRPVSPEEPRGAEVAGSMDLAARPPEPAGEAAKQKLPAGQPVMVTGTGLATGHGMGGGAMRAAMTLKDERAAPAEAEADAASLRRDVGLVFQQANARPEAVRPPQQVLTMRSADPADLIRRATAVANKQGLVVTLVLNLNDQADILIQVPADRYDALVAALVDLTAPQSQSLSNTAYAQGDFYRQALVNYRALNTNRLQQQSGRQMEEVSRADRLLEAAGKSPAPETRGAVGGMAAAVAAPEANAPAAAAGGTAGAVAHAEAMAVASRASATTPEPTTVDKEMAATAAASGAVKEAKAAPLTLALRKAQVTPAPAASPAAPAVPPAPAAPGAPEMVDLQISILKAP